MAQQFSQQEAALTELGIKGYREAYWNLSPESLIEQTLCSGEGKLSDKGAIRIMTGKFTGRSPKDRFIVKDELTTGTVDWNAINQPFASEDFDRLYDKITAYFVDRDLYVRDAYACADPAYQLNVRLICEKPWSNLFAYNMFQRPTEEQLTAFTPDWTVICAPGFMADPAIDNTRQENFAIVNFSRKCIIVGGTGYTGEIKKGIFSVLNFVLPTTYGVLPMHCSANVGEEGDTAIFFGLSGTGKTTLSADPNRKLIGDDEHGWSDQGVFNFEGGCYAKCIDLSEEKEPDIYRAIKHGAILENINFLPGTRQPDFADSSITQNTRVSYPLDHIDNLAEGAKAGMPRHVFFLTCDAFGVLPPISRLSKEQAQYYFISGYTAKVAGTEAGIDEPQATFSACFGAPFMPLHPTKYATMLGKKMEEHDVKIWLVNTGWSGGSYGVGSRIKLAYTRAMISAALKGELDQVAYVNHEQFGLQMPVAVSGVPSSLLDPKQTWEDQNAYDRKADELAQGFQENFLQFANLADQAVLAAAPKVFAILD